MQEIARILREDDPQAWERLVTELSPLLIALAGRTFSKYGYSADRATCEDVASQVWVNLLAHERKLLKSCRSESDFMPLLHTLVRNRSIDHIRKNRRYRDEQEAEPDEGHSSSPAPELEREWLQTHIQALPTRERCVIELFFLQELSYKEIELCSGIPLNSIGPTLKRGLRNLRSRIENEESS